MIARHLTVRETPDSLIVENRFCNKCEHCDSKILNIAIPMPN
jgi:hypothetical protein